MPVGETTIQRPRPEQILAFASNPQQTLASLVSNSQVESRQLVACSKYATSLLCYRLRILKVGSESAQPTRERLPLLYSSIILEISLIRLSMPVLLSKSRFRL